MNKTNVERFITVYKLDETANHDIIITCEFSAKPARLTDSCILMLHSQRLANTFVKLFYDQFWLYK